ncbi:amino acid transporter AVT6A-like [Cynara cardunculus var. scolymus]|uniref:amino acid transporter AVT6A-like n=1 Tax=Cynara cardunculus var. scolymus TaxID=59895 RepID=UPI000D625171|nr:amino acid transporter AVT6A-like [Cynara cardunculus var. scolymus]
MALPATMKVLGLIPGIALIIFMAFLTNASIDLLLRFSRAGKSISYGGVMEDAFGRIGRMLLQVCVLVNNICVLVFYMIIIGMARLIRDVLSGTTSDGIHHAGVLQGWFGEHWWNGRFFVLLVTTLGVFAPLASLKQIGSFGAKHRGSIIAVMMCAGLQKRIQVNWTIVFPGLAVYTNAS